MDNAAFPSFLCPIGRELMRDPVNCADGHSYERASIERWLATKSTSPRTGAQLPNKVLIPNHSLLNSIEEWHSTPAAKVVHEALDRIAKRVVVDEHLLADRAHTGWEVYIVHRCVEEASKLASRQAQNTSTRG